MRTSKPISTIGYNSRSYLIGTLERLRKNGIIEFWAVIWHTAEADEKKDHWHIYMEPARMIQTTELNREFDEYDPLHPNNPLGVIQIKSSKFEDWFLYSIHDPSYLAFKHEKRKHRYSMSDFIVSDVDSFEQNVHGIDMAKYAQYEEVYSFAERGYSFAGFLREFHVPIQQIHYYKTLFEEMAKLVEKDVERGTHKGHEEGGEEDGREEEDSNYCQ